MTRLEKQLLHGSAAALGVSGLAYAAFKHLMTSDDPFSAVNHPLQPWALHLHVIAAPVLIFVVGIIFKDHFVGKLKNGAPPRSRLTGLLTIAVIASLAGSGYLLQVLAADTARRWTAWVHLGLGVLFALAYAAHLVTAPSRSVAQNGARNGQSVPGATVTGIRIARRPGSAP